jgi:hypothetical protein
VGGVAYLSLLNVSTSTLKRFKQRISQLYEQGADYVRIGEYVKNWFKWARSGLGIPRYLKGNGWSGKHHILNRNYYFIWV